MNQRDGNSRKNQKEKLEIKNTVTGNFPGSPLVRTCAFTVKGAGSIPGQGTKIPQAAWHSHKTKQNKTSNRNEECL